MCLLSPAKLGPARFFSTPTPVSSYAGHCFDTNFACSVLPVERQTMPQTMLHELYDVHTFVPEFPFVSAALAQETQATINVDAIVASATS